MPQAVFSFKGTVHLGRRVGKLKYVASFTRISLEQYPKLCALEGFHMEITLKDLQALHTGAADQTLLPQ